MGEPLDPWSGDALSEKADALRSLINHQSWDTLMEVLDMTELWAKERAIDMADPKSRDYWAGYVHALRAFRHGIAQVLASAVDKEKEDEVAGIIRGHAAGEMTEDQLMERLAQVPKARLVEALRRPTIDRHSKEDSSITGA